MRPSYTQGKRISVALKESRQVLETLLARASQLVLGLLWVLE